MRSVSRDYRLYLDDMLDACQRALRYAHGLTLDQLAADDLVRDAVVHNLQIIGEGANHLPDDLLARHPEVEWHKLIGMRNVIAHGYFALDERIVWETIQNDLPTLLPVLEAVAEAEK